jgi:hypothetical protein
VIDETEAAERRPPTGATDPDPGRAPDPHRPSPALVVFGGDDDLVCVDDTCMPRGAAT